jgi:hypothetical protein
MDDVLARERAKIEALMKGVKKGTRKKGNPEYERVGRSYRKRQIMGADEREKHIAARRAEGWEDRPDGAMVRPGAGGPEGAAFRAAAGAQGKNNAHHQTSGTGLSPRHNLGAVTHHEGGAFDHVRDEVQAANEKIVTRAVRGARDHTHLREMHSALGDHAMSIALDHFHEGHLRKILRTVDPHHDPGDGDHHALRARVRDLACGKATPAEPSTGGRRRRKTAPEADGPAEFSRSMGAKARRDEG